MIAIDANILIYAHREGCLEHQAAQRVVEEAAGSRDGWGIPAPCLFEFWSVVAHPSSAGGGSSPAAARGFIDALVETAGAVVLTRLQPLAHGAFRLPNSPISAGLASLTYRSALQPSRLARQRSLLAVQNPLRICPA